MLKLMGKKILTIYAENFCLSKRVIIFKKENCHTILLLLSFEIWNLHFNIESGYFKNMTGSIFLQVSFWLNKI